jgi:1,4-alpha-glucan branching enzyme
MAAHPMQIVGQLPRIQSVDMDFSSWGEGGYADVWLNPKNEWIYPHVLECSVSMNQISHKYYKTEVPIQRRILNQMAREVLLLQSSDWPFILKTGTMSEYASKRVHVHTNLFLELRNMLENNEIDEARLKKIEDEHPIFPEIEFEIFN